MLLFEEFRDIKNYEGLYEVSNLGRIRNKKTGRILKPLKNTNGYLRLDLCKNGIRRAAKVHRLVAEAFIPNPQNLPCVNHKDENKINNCLDNLEWCTYEYNNNYGTIKERISKKISKPVLQLDRDGNLIREWPSIIKVEEETGINRHNISSCCSGKLKSAGGYLWKYKN